MTGKMTATKTARVMDNAVEAFRATALHASQTHADDGVALATERDVLDR
jgi:hypothetical protein